MEIKDTFNYLRSGAESFGSALWDTAVNGKVDDSIAEFRKSQCHNCPLFNNNSCNKDLLAAPDNSVIPLNIKGAIELKDKFSVVRQAIYFGKKYTRGCGCYLPAKWHFFFKDEDLNKPDGTGACPRNKWNKNEYEEHIRKVR